MPKYKDYDDWLAQQQTRNLKFKTEIQNQLPENILNEPLDYPLRKIQDTPEPQESWVDRNALYDFVGNALWGFGETFMVPTVLDIAGEAAGAGDLSAAFGSQDWKDESWSGRAGYMLGTAGGILTGIGAVGKGLQIASKAAGAGTKIAATKLVKEAGEHFTDDIARSVVQSTRSNIKEAAKTAKSTTNFFEFSAKKAIKRNPLGDDLVYEGVQKNVRNELMERIGLKADDEALEALTKSVMTESAESMNKHFGHSIGYKLKQLGWNPKLAQVAGDVAYEATLLGAWDTIVGEVADKFAESNKLDESQWGYDDWYHRTLHGMLIGSVLAPIRYIKGGKAVAFGKSGMVADMGHMRRFITGRYRNAKNMSDNQLKAFANSLYVSSGNSVKMFAGVKNMSESFLKETAGKSLTVSDRAIYENAFNAVKADLPRLAKKLGGEILRDGKESFLRASVGSLAMNASAYKQAYDNGILFTEDYPIDKLIADHWVGMLYMKRGKTIEGKPAMPRFFDQTGMDANGSEIAKMINSMNILGREESTLEIYNRFAHNSLENGLTNTFEKSVMENDLDARQVVEKVRTEFVDGPEYVRRIQSNPDLQGWATQVRTEIRARQDKIKDLKSQGKIEEAEALNVETTKLQDSFLLTEELSNMALFGYQGTTVRPMERQEAIAFVENMGKIRLSDGMLLTTENFDILENRIETAKLKVTEQIQSLGIDHISQSLDVLGLIDLSASKDGKLVLHRSILDALYSLRGYAEKNKTTGDLERPYYDSAATLIEAIENAKMAGMVKIGDEGISYRAQDLMNPENLKTFTDIHKKNTELLHEIVFNSTSPESSWREKMPGWTEKEGFFDEGIIGRTPIWHSIQTANRHKRNRLAYEGFTDRANEFYPKIFDKLNGKETFRVVTKDIEGVETRAELTPELAIFEYNLNKLLKLLGKEGRIGSEPIEITELETIKKDVFEEFGNVISNLNEFTAFNHYLFKNLINDLTGNSKITVSMRKVIAQGLDPESLLTIRQNGLIFRSAKALRTSLTGRQDITESQRKNLNEMINKYEAEIEIPLQDALKSGGMIRFEDKPLDTKLPGNDVADLTQNIQEALNQVNKFSLIELGDLGKSLNDLSTITNDLSESLNTDMVDSKSLRESVIEFSNSGKSLVELLNIYISNKDVVGIRHLLDSREKIDVLNRDISTSKPTEAKSIIEYRRTLEKYIDDAINKRNESLQIDDIDQLDSFINEKIQRISRSDRSNRPHQGNTSISVNQYESKWNLPEGFATNLTEFPRKVMEAFDLLVDPDIARLSIFARELFQSGTNAVISGRYTPKQYIDTVVEPIIKNMRAKLEQITLKDKKAPGTHEEFVLDTYYLVQSALSGKRMPIFTFENGVGNISETTISNWDVGLNKLSRLLGLKEPGSLMLFGSRVGAERGFTSNVTEQLRQEMFSMIESGVMVNLNTKDVLRAGDVAILDKFKSLLEGRGKDSGTEFIPVQLDEKTLIVIPAAKAESIARAWSSRESDLRKDLVTVQNSTVNNPAKAREMVEAYLERELNARFNDAGEMTIELNNSNIQKLVMTTRLLEAFPHIVPEVMNNTISVMDGLSSLKYIKMDSPKGGMALNERTLQIAKDFLPRFLEDGSNMKNAYDVFNSHFFDSEGNPTKHRTLNIFDEKGDGRGYFDSSNIGRKVLTEQLAANNPNLNPTDLAERVDIIMDGYEKVAASVQNGEKYLSLPEMTSMLMAKGARKDWFVWDDAGNVIGFNVALKPIEMYSKIDRETGEIVVSVGKTAYKYHPKFDEMMKVNGEYFTDSIGFESTHKVHRKYNSETGNWESPGIAMSIDPVNDWQGSMRISRAQGESQRLEMDRGAIFIKSVSGIHDATVSFGFSNLMSNTAQRHLNSVTDINKVIRGMTGAYSALSENPFAYKNVAQQLLNWQGESGDAIGRITGIESVLNVNGLPLFEFMIPQIDKMITSEYMGTRNLTSSSVKNGSYSVMTSGSGLSVPERRDNIQFTFGGSGVSHSEWDKPIVKLLAKDGTEGLSFVFKATPDLIKKFGLKDYMEAGHDILVTHDGEVMSPHLAEKYDVSDRNVRKKLDTFEKEMQKYYEEVIQLIKDNSSIKSLGHAALFLNGTFGMREVLDMDHKLNNKLNTTPSKAAIYNHKVLKEGNNPLFQSVHLGKVDLRTPKAGLNDWVITRIEKLLDRRRGPVSEMNFLDVIDPQDADFDLDKSSSLFALPGKVIKEIYNVSGYFSPAEDAFDRVLEEVMITEHLDVHRHKDLLASIERKRPSLIRQQSILSSLLQYYSTVPDRGSNEIFVPGDTKNKQVNRSRNRGFFVAGIRENNKDYTIALREGSELADSMGFMKNLIKATIDIYKGTQSIESRDLDRLMWSHPEHGLLKVTEGGEPGRSLPWDTLPKNTRATLDNFVKEILGPIGDIYNLNRMTDNFVDGTSRKMTAFEMVYKYDQALTKIRYAGYKGGGELEALSLGLLKFLGNNKFSGEAGVTGMSEQPLIKALAALRKGMDKQFASIPHDSNLAEVMAGVSRDSEAITKAIAGIIADEKNMVQITAVQYRLEQISDVVSSLKASRRLDSYTGRYWEQQLRIHEDLITEFNAKVNDPVVVFEKNKANVKRSSGSGFAENVTRFYRKNAEGEVRVVNQFNKGEKMFWRKGDVFVENPKTLVAGSEIINRVRKAMHDAFARIDQNITNNEYQMIEYQYGKFQEAIRNLDKFVDPDAPRTSDRIGLRAEAELRVLSEYLETVGSITAGKSSNLQKQFLYRLLVPDASQNIFDIVGWNPVEKTKRLSPHFNQNKKNEQMVFKFLQRAMEHKAGMIVSTENATEWYQAINDRFKAAFVKQYSPTLDVNVFNFERTSRTAADFSLLPKLDQLPKFVYDMNLNEKAKDVLQSYLNGTYFLDPIETYSLSVDLKAKTFEKAPNMESIGSQIEHMWEGTDNIQLGKGAWYKPAHTFRGETYNTIEKKAPESGLEYHRRTFKECF